MIWVLRDFDLGRVVGGMDADGVMTFDKGVSEDDLPHGLAYEVLESGAGDTIKKLQVLALSVGPLTAGTAGEEAFLTSMMRDLEKARQRGEQEECLLWDFVKRIAEDHGDGEWSEYWDLLDRAREVDPDKYESVIASCSAEGD